MKSTTETPSRRETLNLRISTEERNLIDLAAQSSGKTRTDFILSAARRAAEEALLGRSILSVSPAAYADLMARLDAPPANVRLRQTMNAPAPWTKG
jgi:uncharacterized protein (DUF1778 family)